MRTHKGTTTNAAICSVLLLMAAGCARVQEQPSASTVRHLFSLSPERAADCFARNAERHSSALVSQVNPPDARGHVEVIVRVKNGVTYATADLRPVGPRADGTIMLMVISPRGTRDLVRSLVEGC
jgi:hypothetical protein